MGHRLGGGQGCQRDLRRAAIGVCDQHIVRFVPGICEPDDVDRGVPETHLANHRATHLRAIFQFCQRDLHHRCARIDRDQRRHPVQFRNCLGNDRCARFVLRVDRVPDLDG